MLIRWNALSLYTYNEIYNYIIYINIRPYIVLTDIGYYPLGSLQSQPHFAHPEQIMFTRSDRACDITGVGAVSNNRTCISAVVIV